MVNFIFEELPVKNAFVTTELLFIISSLQLGIKKKIHFSVQKRAKPQSLFRVCGTQKSLDSWLC